MQFTNKLLSMKEIKRGPKMPCSPIPCEGEWVRPTDLSCISGISQGVSTCPTQQGACKLSLNVKNGVIRECLIECIGCSGMSHAAAMAAEIVTDRTLIEACHTALLCDAINAAMKEAFLHFMFGRAQTGFSKGGLPIGQLYDEIGANTISQVSTVYGSKEKGPRYLALNEGYVTRMALDANRECIGYETVNIGKLMHLQKTGMSLDEAWPQCLEKTGRFDDGVEFVDPRKD